MDINEKEIKCVEVTNDRTVTTVATKAVTIQISNKAVVIGLRDLTKEPGHMFLIITPEQARNVADVLINYASRLGA